MKRGRRWFIGSVCGILVVTSLAKAVSAFGTSQIFDLVDPVLGLRGRPLMVGGALIEAMLAAYLLANRARDSSLILLLGFGVCLLVYKAGVHWLAPNAPCPCLGSLTEIVGLTTRQAELITLGLLAYMIAGTALVLWYSRRVP